jgi:sigma-B regulation protein RsbU (phosphoserine phosphatase)
MAKSSKRLDTLNFKLNTLLNITRAINENHTEKELLEKFKVILKNDLKIGRVCVMNLVDDKWECLTEYGTPENDKCQIDVIKDLEMFQDIEFLFETPNPALKDFDIVIPVFNNNKPLSYVLIGDIDEELEGVSPTIKHLNFIQTLSNLIMVAIKNIRLFKESIEREALKRELELASRMQFMLIPDESTFPKHESYCIEAFYKPHFEIGGDYYDVIELDDDNLGFCIADVSGKGVAAAIVMSNLQANLRALFKAETKLADLAGILNNKVMHAANGEKFVTMFMARYNVKTKVLEYINAGHNPPVFYEADSEMLSFLSKGCVGLGMLDEIPIVKQGMIKINQHSKLFSFTDGLVELIDDDDGIETGTKSIEDELTNKEPIKENLKSLVKKHSLIEGSDKIFDDISYLAFEFFA